MEKPENICNSCGFAIPVEKKYCPKCGAPVVIIEPEPEAAIEIIICAECGAAIEDGDTFCGDCGAVAPGIVTERICSVCGAVIEGEDAFCGDCGTAY